MEILKMLRYEIGMHVLYMYVVRDQKKGNDGKEESVQWSILWLGGCIDRYNTDIFDQKRNTHCTLSKPLCRRLQKCVIPGYGTDYWECRTF